MEWQAIALGKEGFSKYHCNLCQQKQSIYVDGAEELWILQSIKETAKVHHDNVAEITAKGLKTIPAGEKG
eukprot:14781097-Ditylum_brightwellii.AAC.1